MSSQGGLPWEKHEEKDGKTLIQEVAQKMGHEKTWDMKKRLWLQGVNSDWWEESLDTPWFSFS